MTRPTLEWSQSGQFTTATIVDNKRALARQRRQLLAVVRPAAAGDGLLAEHLGWVVTTTSFEDVIHFRTKEEAQRHVEAMFALRDH